MDGYYDTHQPLQGTYIPVQHYEEADEEEITEEEITEEEIQAFIASLVEENVSSEQQVKHGKGA